MCARVCLRDSAKRRGSLDNDRGHRSDGRRENHTGSCLHTHRGLPHTSTLEQVRSTSMALAEAIVATKPAALMPAKETASGHKIGHEDCSPLSSTLSNFCGCRIELCAKTIPCHPKLSPLVARGRIRKRRGNRNPPAASPRPRSSLPRLLQTPDPARSAGPGPLLSRVRG